MTQHSRVVGRRLAVRETVRTERGVGEVVRADAEEIGHGSDFGRRLSRLG